MSSLTVIELVVGPPMVGGHHLKLSLPAPPLMLAVKTTEVPASTDVPGLAEIETLAPEQAFRLSCIEAVDHTFGETQFDAFLGAAEKDWVRVITHTSWVAVALGAVADQPRPGLVWDEKVPPVGTDGAVAPS